MNCLSVIYCMLSFEQAGVLLKRLCAFVLSCFSGVWLFATLETVAHQALLSMEFSKQKYWNGLPFSPPEDLPDLGIEPPSPALQADSLLLSHWGSPWERETLCQIIRINRPIVIRILIYFFFFFNITVLGFSLCKFLIRWNH